MILKNKVALITGANKGLGKATAQALVNKGCLVYGIGRNQQTLDDTARLFGPLFHPVHLDITEPQHVQEWFQQTFDGTIMPDILINNAGIGSFRKVDETTEDEWQQMIQTNLNGMFYMTSQVVKKMKQKKSPSHIINIGSILGRTARSDSSAYCASKYGVQGLSEALALELRAYAIKVTCINPGSIMTDFFQSSGIDQHSNMLHPQDIANTIIHVLETPDNVLINEITLRPLNPLPPATYGHTPASKS